MNVKFSELNLRAFGDTVLMAGVVFQGNGQAYVMYFPGEEKEPTFHPSVHVEMTAGDWEVLLKQTDEVEVEVLAKTADGTIVKAFLRKSQRTVDTSVNWKVFKRDGYACRYCGNDDCALTVDHLVTWEEGGPSTIANLVSSCKKCNKSRGNMPYAEWLKSPTYLERSKRLSLEAVAANEAIAATLPGIPRVLHKRSR